MRIKIITNINDQKGLYTDYMLLAEVLGKLGHQAIGIDFRTGRTADAADLAIFLEVTPDCLLTESPRNWFIPNPEWFERRDAGKLASFEKILCKTMDAFRIFSAMSDKCVMTDFLSKDHYRQEIRRERKFLHNPGGSVLRSTDEIIAAWEEYNIEYPLTIVSRVHKGPSKNGNIQFVSRLSEDELSIYQNSHIFHLLPSQYEGWGHSLHEGQGVGAVIITTNAPPMNECGNIVINPSATKTLRSANIYTVNKRDIRNAADRAWKLPESEIMKINSVNRRVFKVTEAFFIARLGTLLSGSPPQITAATSSSVVDYSSELARIKRHYYYPWQKKNAAYPSKEVRDIHTLLDRISFLEDIIEEKDRQLINR